MRPPDQNVCGIAHWTVLAGLFLGALLAGPRVLGQGMVNFNNRVVGTVVAPVFGPEPGSPDTVLQGNSSIGTPAGAQVYGGAPLQGSGFSAQLWGGPLGTAESNMVLTIGGNTTFRTGTLAGFVSGPGTNTTLPGVPAGGIATFQVRAWDNRSFSVTSWSMVLADPTVLRGASLPFDVGPLGGGPTIPPQLAGLTSFNLHTGVVPTPMPAPQITQHPQSVTVQAGQDATFAVTASGGSPMFFRWRFQNNPLLSATNSFLNLIQVQPHQAGAYSVVVSNQSGVAISSNAVLTVLGDPPSIAVQPASRFADAGSRVEFSVVATGTPPLFYQWRFLGNALAGATAPLLVLTNVQPSAAGPYSVLVSNAYGVVLSSNAVLVTTNGPPFFAVHPAGQAVLQGATVSFAPLLLGARPMQLQWQFNGGEITGATNDTFWITNVQINAAGAYRLVAGNAFGLATSASAMLAVSIAPAGSIVFNNRVVGVVLAPVYGPEPDNPALIRHGNPTNGFPPGLQEYGGLPLSGAQFTAQLWGGPLGTPEHQLVPAGGPVTVFRTGTAGAGFVAPPATNPGIPGVPENVKATAQLRAWDNRQGTITNWEGVLGDPTVPRGRSLPFETDPLGGVLTFSPNLNGLRSFNLHIPAPRILESPVSRTVLAGSDVTLTVRASGEAPLAFQWTLDGSDLAAGQTSTLTLTNVQWWHHGQYAVRVSNAQGEVTSAAVQLMVLTPADLQLPGLGANGEFGFTLFGNPMQQYAVEFSTNLLDWQVLATLAPSRFGTRVIDTNAISASVHFYRARLQSGP